MGIPFSFQIIMYYNSFQKEISKSFLSSCAPGAHRAGKNEVASLMEIYYGLKALKSSAMFGSQIIQS